MRVTTIDIDNLSGRVHMEQARVEYELVVGGWTTTLTLKVSAPAIDLPR